MMSLKKSKPRLANDSCCNGDSRCPPSPCLSQRSCATSVGTATTTASSGVCCDHSSSCQSNDSCCSSSTASSSRHVHACDGDERIRRSRTTSRVEGRRDQKINSSSTLPARGVLRHGGLGPQQLPVQQSSTTLLQKQESAGSSNSSSSSSPTVPAPITSYHEKTVSLHRGNKGFGFVLRGAKASSPAVRSGHPLTEPISLQYLDEIEEGGVAQQAGLEKGDFLLNVNGVDVRMSPHEHVVNLIRQFGDQVTMSVASPIYMKQDPLEVAREKARRKEAKKAAKAASSVMSTSESASNIVSNGSLDGAPSMTTSVSDCSTNTAGRSRSRAPPPAPPKRDPSTTLSVGRNQTRSLCISGTVADVTNGPSQNLAAQQSNKPIDSAVASKSSQAQQQPQECHYQKPHILPVPAASVISQSQHQESNTATIRSRSARKMSALELEEFFQRQEEFGVKSSPYAKNGSGGSEKRVVHTLKGKKDKNRYKSENKNKMGRRTHSASDIQLELLIESQKNIKTVIDTSLNCNSKCKGTSQEDLRTSWMQYAQSETVTLKNGKIVNRKSPPSDARSPSPLHPPPPPPQSEATAAAVKSSTSQSKSQLESQLPHSSSDYANFQMNSAPDSRKSDSSSLSSFRPAQPLPEDADHHPSSSGSEVKQSPVTSSQVKPQGILKKSVKHVNSISRNGSSSTCSSVYARAESAEDSSASVNLVTNGKAAKPFIPDPDYSTSEDETTLVNDPPKGNSSNGRDMSSFKSNLESTTCGKDTECSHELRQRSCSTDSLNSLPPPPPPLVQEEFDIEEESNSNATTVVTISHQSSSIDKSNDSQNKVKVLSLEFERRSSLTNSASSSDSSGSFGPPTVKQSNSRNSDEARDADAADSGTSSQLSSDVEDKQQVANNYNENRNAVVAALNKKNMSAISDKPSMSNYNSSTLPSSGMLNHQSHSHHHHEPPKTLPKPEFRAKRVSFGDPPEQPTPTTKSPPKSWSEKISSAIKAAKCSPSSPKSGNPTQLKDASSITGILVNERIVSNEVDVLAQLVPPPPEFAAPPPHLVSSSHHHLVHPSSNQPRPLQEHKVQVQVRGDQGVKIVSQQQQPPAPAHVVQKPVVAKSNSNMSSIHVQQQDPHQRVTQTPPSSHSSEFSDTASNVSTSSAASRLGTITLTQQQAAAYRAMNPQQQAQYAHHLQQQRQLQLNQQQFATLSRAYTGQNGKQMSMSTGHSHNAMHQSQIQQSNDQQQAYAQNHQQFSSQGYQQFATLSRAGQKAAADRQQQQQQQISSQMSTSLYNDFNRLSVQNRVQRSASNASPGPQPSVSMSSSGPSSITTISLSQAGLSQQQLQSLTPLQRQQLLQRLHQQQQQQQFYVQQQLANGGSQQMMNYQTHPSQTVHHQPVATKSQAPQPPNGSVKHVPVNFPRRAMVEWTVDDVSDWLVSIGMSDYKSKFEYRGVNGMKLLRIDTNELTSAMGIRSSQHQGYILHKIKQYLHYQQQHPPNGANANVIAATH